ncbi:MAG: hypothetical protein PWP34_1600 [Desulfuromonadales bacterium]|nr:hypothetical protein [Desulfuromonadales bacterium]
MKIRTLFLSTCNSCRSQMAEGLVNHHLGDRVSALSAGTEPTAVNPIAVAVMSEIGIDISCQYSKDADDFAEENFDYVITLLGEGGEKCLVHGAISYCGRCGEVCPHLEKTSHGGERLYLFGFPDPSKTTGDDEKVMAEFRKSRDRIETEIMRFFRTR